MENKYQRGKIYKIWDNGYNKCYIGSTCEDLNRRMAGHKRVYRRYLNGKNENFTVFAIFDDYGVENCKIELLENYPCNSREELRQREGQHQRENECANKQIAGRDNKQYYEENKEVLNGKKKIYVEKHKPETKAYKQKWYKENKEHQARKARENYEANREEIIEQKKQYYKDHKQEIQARKQKQVSCECGKTMPSDYLKRHLKTLEHQSYINQMNQQEQINSS